jgi:hypothetical protein
MSKSIVLRNISILTALLLIGINLGGCDAGLSSGNPLLPVGFTEALVPNIGLDGYVYLNQGIPISISPDVAAGMIPQISIESAQLWLGPDVNAAGGAVQFGSEANAGWVSQTIKSYNLPVWTLSDGNKLYGTYNDGGTWTASLRDGINQQQMVSPKIKYPEIQSDFTNFPQSPAMNPCAAGFLNLNGTLLDSIGNKLPVADYKTALQSARISRVSFIAYTGKTFEISRGTLNKEYLNSLQPGVIALGRSEYPGVALSLFFDKAMTDAGLTKYSLNNVDIYEYPAGSVTVLVAYKGNVIYAAASLNKETAEKLLLSCFS